MRIKTEPKYLQAQKELVAKLVYAQDMPADQGALMDGLLDWLQALNEASEKQAQITLEFEVEE